MDMMIFRRMLLFVLMISSLGYLGYQLFWVFNTISPEDSREIKYVHLVDEYQMLKMQRLVLEEQYALAQTKEKVLALAKLLQSNTPTNGFNLNPQMPRDTFAGATASPFTSQISGRPSFTRIQTQPIALSLEQSKTFEELEAYINTNRPLQQQPFTSDEKYLLMQSPNNFTLQVMGVRDNHDFMRVIKENNLQSPRIFHTYYLNKDWYVLVCGNYKSHTDAVKAIEALDESVKHLKPWIRQFSSVQKAIQLYR